MDLEQPFTVYAPGLAGVPKDERYLSPGVIRRFVARGDANLTLRNVLRMLHSDTVSWDLFVHDMQSLFDGIAIELNFNESTDENIQAFFQLPGGPRLPIDAAGTSILQASQILAYVALFKPQVLILDEPDSHLHPDNQRALCDLIYNLTAGRHFQTMISSHSRHVLDTMKTRSQVAWLSKGVLVDEPDLNATSVLLDLGALDSVDYFADGETRCVVATEDSDRDPLRAVLWSNGFIEDGTEVASYTGCSKVDSALVLGAFLSDKAPNVHLVVHRNRDYMTDADALSFSQRLQQADAIPFLTDGNDIESYFLNAEHLHSLNPTIAVDRIQELIEQATAETADKSRAAIVNQRTTQAFKVRQDTGQQPNHGQIALDAIRDYDANPVLMRRGKDVIKRVQSLLHQELGNNPRVFHPSEHLRIGHITELSARICPVMSFINCDSI